MKACDTMCANKNSVAVYFKESSSETLLYMKIAPIIGLLEVH